MAKVTGIGGIFFRSRGDGGALATWYQTHLGMRPEEWGGVILNWAEDKAADGGMTVWHIADHDSKWFSPSDASFMVNYRVDDLDELLAQLRQAGVEIVGEPQSAENGKFAWIMDPDGNKVELWEPAAAEDEKSA